MYIIVFYLLCNKWLYTEYDIIYDISIYYIRMSFMYILSPVKNIPKSIKLPYS